MYWVWFGIWFWLNKNNKNNKTNKNGKWFLFSFISRLTANIVGIATYYGT